MEDKKPEPVTQETQEPDKGAEAKAMTREQYAKLATRNRHERRALLALMRRMARK